MTPDEEHEVISSPDSLDTADHKDVLVACLRSLADSIERSASTQVLSLSQNRGMTGVLDLTGRVVHFEPDGTFSLSFSLAGFRG